MKVGRGLCRHDMALPLVGLGASDKGSHTLVGDGSKLQGGR